MTKTKINLHTHTTFCDGKSSAEEVVRSALEKNFTAIGFSSHGYTSFYTEYCMADTDAYISEIERLKRKYSSEIEILLGVEEDAHEFIDRSRFEYIIGSSHFSVKDGKYLEIDGSHEGFKKCLEAWNGDTLAFANEYYSYFCDYLEKRRPDVVGHFDLITKYDELGESVFLDDPEYLRLSEGFVRRIARQGLVFELNTGAISRGMRKTPYPHIDLLRAIKDEGGRVMISSDSHHASTLDFYFDEATDILKYIGYKKLTTVRKGKFTEEEI